MFQVFSLIYMSIYLYIYLILQIFSIIGYYKMLNIVPYAIYIVYLFFKICVLYWSLVDQ